MSGTPADSVERAQVEQMIEAERALGRMIGGPLRWSKFNGVTLAAMAGLTGLVAVAGSLGGGVDWIDGLIAGLLAVFAKVELGGREKLRRLDPEGARRLAWNQLALGAAVVAYCVWKIYTPSELESQVEGIDPAMAHGLIRSLTQLTYSVVLTVSAIYQGGLAWYYGRAARRLAEYVEQTPGWILDVQRRR